MFRFVAALLMCCCVAQAQERLILSTPTGVYESTVSNGVPSTWVKINATVIVQGGGHIPVPPEDPDKPNPPEPDPSDPVIEAVADISRSVLKDDKDATALYAIVDTVASGYNGPSERFVEALRLGIGLADGRLDADGRFEKWFDQVVAVTQDGTKMMAGLRSAFNVDLPVIASTYSALKAGASEVDTGGRPLFGLDIAGLLAVLRLILELLDQLSEIWG